MTKKLLARFSWSIGVVAASVLLSSLIAPRFFTRTAPTYSLASALSMKAVVPDGAGYWLVGKDGGVFALGAAHYYGSLPQEGVDVHDIVGIVTTPSGNGYWLFGADGSVYPFGDARRVGDARGKSLGGAIVGAASTSATPTTVPTGATYSAFQNDAVGLVPRNGKATVLSLPIDPPFSGNVLLQASGTFGQAGAPIPPTGEVWCLATLDGHLFGESKIYPQTSYTPTVLALTGAANVSAGQRTVSISCQSHGVPATYVGVNAFVLVTHG